MQDRHEHDLGLAHDLRVLSGGGYFSWLVLPAPPLWEWRVPAAAGQAGQRHDSGGQLDRQRSRRGCLRGGRAAESRLSKRRIDRADIVIESGVVRSDMPIQLRLLLRYRRRGSGHDRPDLAGHHQELRRGRGHGHVRLALRPGRPELAPLYSQDAVDQNYLRGVQVADAERPGRGSPRSSPPATAAAGRTSISRCSTRSKRPSSARMRE